MTDHVLDALQRHAKEQPAGIAFEDDRGAIAFAELAGRVGGLAAALAAAPDVVGIHGPGSIDWVIADLAIAAAGRTAVPLPLFFSSEQIDHLLRDSGVGLVLTTGGECTLGLPRRDTRAAPAVLAPRVGGGKVIYTSGSTGRPKGVRLGARQIDLSCLALIAASGAGASDRHLSVLPFPLLLETICGIYLPLLVGGRCRIVPAVAAAPGPMQAIRALATAVATWNPTTTVLVPDLLAGWVAALDAGLAPAPNGLRYVAAGGAPVAPSLADRAWRHGIPVHEGYGLSECCSVVAVNRPGRRRAGTVGEVLPGIDVAVEDGEIVVRSPTVMDGYVGAAPVPDGCWRTGDLGEWDARGYLRVLGRKDNLIVLASGRNISPEWVEAALCADPAVARAVVLGHGRAFPVAMLVAAPAAADRLAALAPDDAQAWLATRCTQLPAYARPRRLLLVDDAELRSAGLLSPNGRPRRDAIAAHLSDRLGRIYAETQLQVTSNALL